MSKQKHLAPPTLIQEAAILDKELREQWGNWRRVARVVGGLFRQIRDRELHKYISKLGCRKRYVSFEEYIHAVTGGIANGTIWAFMRIHGLTEGPHALPPNEVDEMPQANAYELSKLKPE